MPRSVSPRARQSAKAPSKAPSRSKTARSLTPDQVIELLDIVQAELISAKRTSQGGRETLTEQLESVGRLGGDATDISIDMLAAATVNISINRANSQIVALQRALTHLRQNPSTFGLCEVCQNPIAFERLEVVPTTKACSLHA
ncbi:MAG: TraR/DksA C4-type zinc finger protein [Gemmatimonadales bacterium]|nr:TraR/DksA C4-type zinc finger protein [Gemmatimonadales bacterium]